MVARHNDSALVLVIPTELLPGRPVTDAHGETSCPREGSAAAVKNNGLFNKEQTWKTDDSS